IPARNEPRQPGLLFADGNDAVASGLLGHIKTLVGACQQPVERLTGPPRRQADVLVHVMEIRHPGQDQGRRHAQLGVAHRQAEQPPYSAQMAPSMQALASTRLKKSGALPRKAKSSVATISSIVLHRQSAMPGMP